MAVRIYCSCGRLLKIKVRRDGVTLQCPEHGVLWRYVVDKPDSTSKQNERPKADSPSGSR
jgi:hypothetical protein